MMKILYFTWDENSKEDMVNTLMVLGHEVVSCRIPYTDYDQDENFTENLEKVLREYGCESIFSFNFLPVIARTAERFRIKYISWVYDCPHWTLYSPEAQSPYNYIFVFDRMQCQRLAFLKLPHLYHFPLAVHTSRLKQQLGAPAVGTNTYHSEISFVGSLYENTMYDRVSYLPEYLKGYLEGVMQAQGKIYGYNLVSDVMEDQMIALLSRFIPVQGSDASFEKTREIYTSMVNGALTGRERIHLLGTLAAQYPVTIHTASDIAKVPDAIQGGTVEYQQEMPQVFRKSKINLNITLRSIQSAIPLRALDIMGAGGFLLTNYQPELAEYFEDGKELAFFTSEAELLDKAGWYLKHDKERETIASQGFERVQELFSYEVRVSRMLQMVNEAFGT